MVQLRGHKFRKHPLAPMRPFDISDNWSKYSDFLIHLLYSTQFLFLKGSEHVHSRTPLTFGQIY